MQKSNVELCVQVNGRTVEEYKHKGKVYIEGRRGSKYEIFLRNDSAKNRMFVLSVDGLNVITDDKNWERGYVLRPWQSVAIPGWRKDANNTAHFNFSSVGKSYNQHNFEGDKANVGVIGLMVFDEKVAQVVIPNQYYQHFNNWPIQSQPYYNGYSGGWSGI